MIRNIATTLYKEGPLGMWWGRWVPDPNGFGTLQRLGRVNVYWTCSNRL